MTEIQSSTAKCNAGVVKSNAVSRNRIQRSTNGEMNRQRAPSQQTLLLTANLQTLLVLNDERLLLVLQSP